MKTGVAGRGGEEWRSCVWTCIGGESGNLEGHVKERLSVDVTLQDTFVSGCECVRVCGAFVLPCWCVCPWASNVYLILREFEMLSFWFGSLFSVKNQCVCI